jgi:CRISPR-associated protein Cmr6
MVGPKKTNILLNSINDYIIKYISNYCYYYTTSDKDSDIQSNARNQAKKESLDALIKNNQVLSVNCTTSENYITEVIEAVKSLNIKYIVLKLKLESNLLTGWSPLYFIDEVPTAWDLILDVPYIPGTTIKGLIRSSFASAIHNSAKEKKIFGDKGEVGGAIFLDAYPVKCDDGILIKEVMTPHYKKGIKTELDVTPIPIIFAAVKKGTEFKTAILFDDELSEELILDAARAVGFASRYGVGRKTTRGYGKFSVDVSVDVEDAKLNKKSSSENQIKTGGVKP